MDDKAMTPEQEKKAAQLVRFLREAGPAIKEAFRVCDDHSVEWPQDKLIEDDPSGYLSRLFKTGSGDPNAK